MDKTQLRKSAAYRSLMENYFSAPLEEEQLAELESYLIYQDREWVHSAAASKLVDATAEGDWQANLLLIHPSDPNSFQRLRLQRCRTEQLAHIVASYAGKVRCDDGSGACRLISDEQHDLCAN